MSRPLSMPMTGGISGSGGDLILDAEASGASNLSYVGNPTVRTVDTSGSSTVEEK